MSRFKRDVVINVSSEWLARVPQTKVEKAIGRMAFFQGDRFSYVHISEDRENAQGSLIAYYKIAINPNTQADYTLRTEYDKLEGTYRYYI